MISLFQLKAKGKSIPVQTTRVPEGSDSHIFNQNMKVLSALPTGRLISVRGWVDSRAGRIMSMKNSNDPVGNRTRDLPACSAVPEPTAPPRAPSISGLIHKKIMGMGIGLSRRLLCPRKKFGPVISVFVRSQWPRGLRRRYAAARLLRFWVRIPSAAWMSVCCDCCVLSGRGLCDELITHPEESYRLWCVVVCDLETL